MSYAYGNESGDSNLIENQHHHPPTNFNGPLVRGEYPSPATSMSSPTAAASPTAYSMPNNQIESSIGPSRVRTRGQRKAAASMNVSTVKPISRIPASRSGSVYPPTPESISSTSANSASSPVDFRHISASPSPSSRSSQSNRSQRQTPQRQQQVYRMSMSPASTVVSPTTYGLHLPGPQPNSLLPSTSHHPGSPVVPRPYSKPKQRKQRLFNIDRKAICEYHLAHPTEKQEVIARHYGVERSTISKILKHKEKWLRVPMGDSLGCGPDGFGIPMKIAKHRPSKFPEIEAAMMNWLYDRSAEYAVDHPNELEHQRHDLHGPFSDASLREKARAIAESYNITSEMFKASSGWVENFKHRHGIKNGFWGGYSRTVTGRNSATARALGVGHPVSTPASTMFVGVSSYMAVGADDEEDESDEGEGDENEDAQMVDSPYAIRAMPSTLSHLRVSSLSRPPWSTDSSATSASAASLESLSSPHPDQEHHRGYDGHPSWSAASTASEPSAPMTHLHSRVGLIEDPLDMVYPRQHDQHRRSTSGVSVVTISSSTPASPYTHSQSQSPLQRSHISSQSMTHPQSSHGSDHVCHAQNMVEESQDHHPHVHHHDQAQYVSEPTETTYNFPAALELEQSEGMPANDDATTPARTHAYSSDPYTNSSPQSHVVRSDQYAPAEDRHHHHRPTPVLVDSSTLPQPLHSPLIEYQQSTPSGHIHPDIEIEGILDAPLPPTPPIPNNTIPTLEDCEEYLNRILYFVDTPKDQGGGGGNAPGAILNAEKREWLRKIKITFFQFGAGIPIDDD